MAAGTASDKLLYSVIGLLTAVHAEVFMVAWIHETPYSSHSWVGVIMGMLFFACVWLTVAVVRSAIRLALEMRCEYPQLTSQPAASCCNRDVGEAEAQ